VRVIQYKFMTNTELDCWRTLDVSRALFNEQHLTVIVVEI